MSSHYNVHKYRSLLATTILGSLLAVPKIAFSVMDIAIGCCGATEKMWRKKAERIVKISGLLLEDLYQAVFAEFFLDVCPAQKFHIKWLLFSFAACTIKPFCSSLYSFGSYLRKYREESWKMNLLCCVGIVLACITFGFAVTTIVRDIQSMCRAAKAIN